MPRGKTHNEPTPGTFLPSTPEDTQAVVFLFAVAARVACYRPDTLGDLDARLRHVTSDLVPPESVAAQECARLWAYFKKAAATPKTKLREAAGRALCRDLDTLGQRMDLAPLASWSRLPRAMESPHAEKEEPITQTAVTLEALRRRARKQVLDAARGKKLRAKEVGGLLELLHREDLQLLLVQLVGDGTMGRAEGAMLVRWLAKGEELTSEDEALIDCLERIGEWLAKA